MSLVEKLRSPSVDLVAGWGFVVAAIVNTLWIVADQVIYHSSLSSDLPERYRRYETPLWILVASDLITLPLLIVIGLGLMRGRGWALWIQGLISFRFAFDYVVRPPLSASSLHVTASFGLSVLVFIYAGLRILGVLGDGPRPLLCKVAPLLD